MKTIQTSEDSVDKDCCVPIVDYVKGLTSRPYWRVFVSVLFTVLHDAAGLFSASPTIRKTVNIFEYDWQNILLVVMPIVLFDTGSELLLVIYHDIPLCEKRELGTWRIRIGVVGQILTSLSWIALLVLVVYDRLYNTCKEAGKNFFECSALLAGINSTIVILMVFIKNSMTLKEFHERAYKYPVICNESLLFLYHLLRGEPQEIVKDFKAFYNWSEDQEITCSTDPSYNAIMSFSILILMDIAAISSVSNLIIVPGDSAGVTFLKAVPFLSLVFLDIGSEVLILVYHDLPLCNHEDHKILKHQKKFQLGRIIQIFVTLCWIGALVYMVFVYRGLNCYDQCVCPAFDTELSCNSTFCPGTGTCTTPYCSASITNVCLYPEKENHPDNNTIDLPDKFRNFTFLENGNCSRPYDLSEESCLASHPSVISCVLLAMILFEGIYETIGIFFKSYLLPITLPDYVMFQLYLMNDNIEPLINRLGKNEFGFGWDTSRYEKLIEQ